MRLTDTEFERNRRVENLCDARCDRSGTIADAIGRPLHPADALVEVCDALSDAGDRRFAPVAAVSDLYSRRIFSVDRVAEVYDRFPVPADCLAEAVARGILPVDRGADRDDRVPERVVYFRKPVGGVILRVDYIRAPVDGVNSSVDGFQKYATYFGKYAGYFRK